MDVPKGPFLQKEKQKNVSNKNLIIFNKIRF
jgi:hypothetical protein